MNKVISQLKEMEDYTKYLTEYVEELRDRAGDNMLDYFAEMRKFPREVIDEQKIFYIGDATEMLLPNYIDKVESFGVISPTNRRPIFHNRFVMPIMDEKGMVINLVGYSKEANERYVYGTAKYYRRRDTLYGMENIELAYQLGYMFVTEGITDTIRMRSLGYKNTFARCGTHGSDEMNIISNRMKHGIIRIPDHDKAGQAAVKKWECCRGITINPFIAFKDIDSMCYESEEMCEVVKAYMDEAIRWITKSEHNGMQSENKIVSII